MANKTPFLSIDYEDNNPIVEMKLKILGEEHSIRTYADTGNTFSLVINKKRAERYGLKEEDSFSEDVEAKLADGSQIACLFYRVLAKFADKERPITLVVLNPDKKIERPQRELRRIEGLEQDFEDEPILGRGMMDQYDVLFAGTSTPKKISFAS